MNCPYCGVEFIKSNKQRKYCCPDHEIKYNRNKNKDKKRKIDRKYEAVSIQSMSDSYIRKVIWHDSNGTIKGADITPGMIINRREKLIKSRANKKKAPPPSCKVWFKECEVCGELFTARMPNAKYCSDKCSMVRNLKGQRNKYWKERELIKPFNCKECGKLIIPKYGNRSSKIFCPNGKCGRKYYSRYHKEAKERAEKAGVYYEHVNWLRVFKRDGWRCQICGKKLSLKNRGTYKDNAPELDHIIPWAQGGEHSYRNTQCLCRKCNQEKGIVELGQLRMFG